ncbi:hypothetical protein HJG60_008551 [Phyllostomus discolor]|uniref:Uncharacterized protein n=1 Tax=Phyllostomus discolor TaxID=89673 RepID=A0A833Z1H1_9CHIR|nr:hypothetical protein HJG60_008551 [Phyllostomus discolor]
MQQCSHSSAHAPELTLQCSCTRAHTPVLMQQCSHSSAHAPELTLQCSCTGAHAPVLTLQYSRSSAHIPVLTLQCSCTSAHTTVHASAFTLQHKRKAGARRRGDSVSSVSAPRVLGSMETGVISEWRRTPRLSCVMEQRPEKPRMVLAFFFLRSSGEAASPFRKRDQVQCGCSEGGGGAGAQGFIQGSLPALVDSLSPRAEERPASGASVDGLAPAWQEPALRAAGLGVWGPPIGQAGAPAQVLLHSPSSM